MCEIIRACLNGYFLNHHLLRGVRVALVIASRPDAGGIEKARKMGFLKKNIVVIRRKRFTSPTDYGKAILQECRKRKVNLIAQCGWLPKTPSNVIAAYRTRIFNQHPGPLDQARSGFGGMGMHGRAVHHAVKHFAKLVGRPFLTEATVHRVTNTVDGGAILGIRPVEIHKGDTAETLAARVLPYEHNLVVETILRFSEYGGPEEIHRKKPLIRKNEKKLLEEAKTAGRAAFPNG